MAEILPAGKTACPHCGALVKSAGLAAGTAVNCPKCGKAFRVGQAEQPPLAAAPAKAASREAERSDGRSPAERLNEPRARPVVAVSKPVKTDTLVDPNLLPPPPPRAKPKATEIAVVCKLCGTRTYAPLDKAGQEIKCPDCHSRNVVPRPQAPAPAQAKAPGPTLDDVEDFPLSDVIERPKYRPLVVPRGDDIELASFDSAKVQSPAAAPTETRPSRVTVEPVEDEPSAEDDEVILEPPVERADLVRDPRSILPSPDLEPPDPMYDGRYEGGAIGDGVDPRSPDAWKRAPLVYGILGFVFMSSAVARVVLYGLWLTLVAVLVKLSLAFLKEEGVAQAGAIATLAVGVPLALTWLFSFASTMQAVIEATGNGNEEVNWPDWNFFEWFGGARFVLAATFAAGLPGAIAGAVTLAANFDKPAMAAFGIGAPPVISWMVLFPIFLYSMLIEDNPLAIFSGQALRNLKAAADGWVFTYMYSIGLMVLLGFAAGMLAADSFLVSLVGGIGLMAVFLLHARIVGRLMWYASERGAKAAVVREVAG